MRASSTLDYSACSFAFVDAHEGGHPGVGADCGARREDAGMSLHFWHTKHVETYTLTTLSGNGPTTFPGAPGPAGLWNVV